MAEYKLTLEKREVTGKKLKDLRATGMIPSVVYGGGKEPELMASEYVATEKVLLGAGYHSPIDLTVDGKKKLAIVKEVGDFGEGSSGGNYSSDSSEFRGVRGFEDLPLCDEFVN